MQSTDPGAAAVAALLGISSDSEAAWTMFMGSIALELAGRLPGCATMRPVASRIPARSSMPRPIVGAPRLEPPTPGTVDSFMLARVARAKGSKVSWAELFTRYRRWCSGLAPLDAALFGQRLDALRSDGIIRMRHHGNDVFCLDVKPVA